MLDDVFDVIIIGGGPAGLSAALVLGRCLRQVLVCDSGQYRNAYSHSMHGFLTRDGIHPAELRKIAREQLTKYETVKIQNVKVVEAKRENNQFIVVLEDGKRFSSRKLLLATGIHDEWPDMIGAKEIYGRSMFHCPYCDGWELRNEPLAVFGRGDERGGELALELLLWSKDVVLCTNGPTKLSSDFLERLTKNNIPIRNEKITTLESENGILKKINFESGPSLLRRAIFFNTPSYQKSDLAIKLGCEYDEDGGIKVGKYETTNIPGLFVAGDATKDLMQAIVAASAGVEAAFAINTSLIKKDTP